MAGDRRLSRYTGLEATPNNSEFVLLSFEGPDQPYSQAGGLGVRVSELAQALAERGFTTHLIFIGDPHRPGEERLLDERLTLHRWCQWISHYHPHGVYDGELEKVYDFNETVPHFVLESIVRPAADRGRTTVILAEEWHTAEASCRISDLLYSHGLRHRAILLWNANSNYSFHRINWGRLGYAAGLTTVSKYMKHVMWGVGVNPLVIPNGIPARTFDRPPGEQRERLRRAVGRPLLFKIGRFDPDKRWLMAVEAASRLKERGRRVRLLLRGGIEPHGGEVLEHARWRGLDVCDVYTDDRTLEGALAAVRGAAHADVLNLRFFIPDEFKRLCYVAADAVLANSGHEPFGLVGLEVMAVGGVAVVGATGEDYALSFENCLVTETDDPEELVGYLLHLQAHPKSAAKIRREARRAASLFTWDEVIDNLLGKLEYLAVRQGVQLGGT